MPDTVLAPCGFQLEQLHRLAAKRCYPRDSIFAADQSRCPEGRYQSSKECGSNVFSLDQVRPFRTVWPLRARTWMQIKPHFRSKLCDGIDNRVEVDWERPWRVAHSVLPCMGGMGRVPQPMAAETDLQHDDPSTLNPERVVPKVRLCGKIRQQDRLRGISLAFASA